MAMDDILATIANDGQTIIVSNKEAVERKLISPLVY
jgi:hypothetical protein